MNRSLSLIGPAILALVALGGTAEAKRPPKPPRPPHPPSVRHVRETPVPREIQSDLCATEARAAVDARRQLDVAVRAWLSESGVPSSWTPPSKLVDRMVMGSPTFKPVKVGDLDVVRGTITADFSSGNKREILEVFRRHQGGRRLAVLGGILAVVLAALAALSGYIRADEATKGYYTNRLRLLAAAGVGAASVVVYRILT